MNSEHKPGREITYQVGWKKGKIRLDQADRSTASEETPVSEPEPAGSWLLERYIWRPLPAVTGRTLTVIVCVLPAVSFIVTLLLVSALTR